MLHLIVECSAVDVESLDNYALNTLVDALVAGRRIIQNIQPYNRLANARDLFDRSPMLQAISNDDLSTPERLITRLVSLRPAIIQEQRTLRGVGSDVLDDYALGTLVLALVAGGRLVQNIQHYMRMAGGRDLYDRSFILQGISGNDLSTPERLIARLVSLRPAIIQEQRTARGVDEDALDDYSLMTLVRALEAGGRITRNTQDYERLATARDLFDRSPMLQGISNDDLSMPHRLIAKLISLRPAIVQEQRTSRGVGSDVLNNYALTTLVQALAAGGRITWNDQHYLRLATARDLFDRAPTLQTLAVEVASDDEALMRFLITFRDRIAMENQHALGNLNPDDFLFEGAESHYSLSTLIGSLEAGGMITRQERNRLGLNVAAPLQYLLSRRAVIEPEIRNTMNLRRYSSAIDLSLFTYINDHGRELSPSYIKNIVKWSRWFLRDSEVAVRSIYKADEIAAWTLFSFRYVVDVVPGNIAWRLEQVGWNAAADPAGSRRIAVGLLRDVLDYYDGYKMQGVVFDEDIENGLYQIRRLYEWNRDALIATTSGSSSAPSPTPAATPAATPRPAPQVPPAPSAPPAPEGDGAASAATGWSGVVSAMTGLSGEISSLATESLTTFITYVNSITSPWDFDLPVITDADSEEITRLPEPEWQGDEGEYYADDEYVTEDVETTADTSAWAYFGESQPAATAIP